MKIREIKIDYKPKIGKKIDYGIGIVGSGGIVQIGHLPAYKLAGFNVIGIYDKNIDLAKSVAKKFDIPKVFMSLEELLSYKKVSVVDIAIPPHLNLEVVEKVSEAKKHILIQKPMALNYKDAVKIVSIAKENNIKLAVNQNGRWDPAIRASKCIIDQGLIGEKVIASIEMRGRFEWQKFWTYEKLIILNLSIHQLDQFRFLFGEPNFINAITTKYPGQNYKGETVAIYNLIYKGGFIASGLEDGFTWTRDGGIWFRIEGTSGIIKGKVGWYPVFTYSNMELLSKKIGDYWYKPEFDTMWFPHAFIGTMGELMMSIEENRESTISGNDNLKTMQLVFGCYKSAEEKRSIRPQEISY